jgi:preprotein translocase subunit SecA
MQRLGMEKGEAIENKWVTRAIENAQRKVEAHNFDMRKHLLEYDDVANEQRKVIYQQRAELLEADDIHETIEAIRVDVAEGLISTYIPPGSLDEQWDIDGLTSALEADFGLALPLKDWLEQDSDLHEETLRERIEQELTASAQVKEETVGSEVMRRIEKDIMLQVLDNHWKEHLAAMDYLRQGIGLRGYAQKNPKQEYKREAFEMFQGLLERIKHDVVSFLMRVQVRSAEEVEAMEAQKREQEQMQFAHPQAQSALAAAGGEPDEPEERPQTYRREGKKIGRNDPCWCGSGKKFKQCHGKLS